MTPLTLIACLFFLWQQEVPFKPQEDFHLGLDYNFRQRPTDQTPDYERERKISPGGPLPYLIINCKVLKLEEAEVRIKIVKGKDNVVVSKKITVGATIKLDLGFTEDIKDRVTPHEYTIYFLDDKKKELSRIHLFIEEEGAFLVNGTSRGKF